MVWQIAAGIVIAWWMIKGVEGAIEILFEDDCALLLGLFKVVAWPFRAVWWIVSLPFKAVLRTGDWVWGKLAGDGLKGYLGMG